MCVVGQDAGRMRKCLFFSFTSKEQSESQRTTLEAGEGREGRNQVLARGVRTGSWTSPCQGTRYMEWV